MKICHVTSAHDSDDFRIFYSECCSLASQGDDVYLVAHGESREEKGVHVIGAGVKPDSRKERMTTFAKKVVEKALSLDCELYHLHDPELMQFIPKIAKKGKKVVFDSHEDYKYLMLAKEWIPKPLRGIVSAIYTGFEHHVCKYLDGYIACYHWTEERVKKWVPNIKLVFNYPEWKPVDYEKSRTEDKKYFCYAGGIADQWMHENVIKAVSAVPDASYLLAGSLSDEYGKALTELDEWKAVDYLGRVKYTELPTLMYSKSIAGMCLLDYIPQCMGHIGNLSNTKLFEYMVNGLPVICTDFDLWKGVVEEHKCGICVNPHDIKAISDAITWMINNPDEAAEMGKRANEAVRTEYNWENTSKGLFEVYNYIKNKYKETSK